jgi:hypothetical protein
MEYRVAIHIIYDKFCNSHKFVFVVAVKTVKFWSFSKVDASDSLFFLFW